MGSAAVLEKAATIGSHALALYVILACHARADSGAFYPSIRRLIQLMGRSRPVVFAALRALEAQKLIAVEQRRSDHGGLSSNLWNLLPVPEALPDPVRNEAEELFRASAAVSAVTACGLVSPDGRCAADARDDAESDGEDGDIAVAIASGSADLPREPGLAIIGNSDQNERKDVDLH